MLLNRKFGPYVLLKRIGIGGMAELFLALKLGPGSFDKFLVVKCILEQFNDHRDFVRLFYREAELCGLLHHPNVVQAFDCDIERTTHFLAMEYMEGVTIAEMAERGAEHGQPLPQDYAIKLCIDACEGLHYLHTLADHDGQPLGIVHRDVSPQNIFVEYSGIAKVFDLGVARIARDAEDDPHRGMLAGKYAYMSPEQCRGGAVDARSDVFSLGIILYELTTGHRLFKRETQAETLRAVCEDEITPPTQLLERYPRFLERVVLKALTRELDERYGDALTLAEDLRKFLKISGAKPSAQLVGAYVSKLFARELEADALFKRAARAAAEQRFGRRDPLAGLSPVEPNELDALRSDDILIPEPEPQIPAPSDVRAAGIPLASIPATMPVALLRPEPDEARNRLSLGDGAADIALAERPIERPSDPSRLASVEIAEEVLADATLSRARRTNRILLAIAILAILAGAIAFALLLLQRPNPAPPPNKPTSTAPSPDDEALGSREASRFPPFV